MQRKSINATSDYYSSASRYTFSTTTSMSFISRHFFIIVWLLLLLMLRWRIIAGVKKKQQYSGDGLCSLAEAAAEDEAEKDIVVLNTK